MTAAAMSNADTSTTASGPSGSTARAVDLAHLARQTMGNRDLEREVLHLFLRQSERTLQRFDDPAAPHADLAHVILGSARGIGAHAVARAAEALETVLRRDPAGGQAELALLRREVDAANGFIRQVVFCA